ncbi:MAG: hypothetical protein AAGB12_13135 [Pseudomonadota bacterium]
MEQVKASKDVSEVVNVSELLAENKLLKRRLARLEQEQAILKKAALICNHLAPSQHP